VEHTEQTDPMGRAYRRVSGDLAFSRRRPFRAMTLVRGPFSSSSGRCANLRARSVRKIAARLSWR